MIFSSPIFLFMFIPLFFAVYFFTVKKYRNIVALIGSILFYSWGGATFLGTLLISLLLDWHLINQMHKAKDKKIKRFYFVVVLFMNIGLLVYYKYSNFFVLNVNSVLDHLQYGTIKWTEILLPIGISFIVFHKISYLIEIFREEKNPTDKISDYFLYILLFPMSIAGPIIKYQDIADQLSHRESRFEDMLYGSYRFSIGLFKKVWIADNVAIVADDIFNVPTDNLGIEFAWLGIVCYAFQIYFDFSGYADMAIGLSRIMGFKVMENFNMPYISQNISEFWRRWHISLSSWMKNYIYIPMGGNRRSKVINYFNLWTVFFVSGLWHGASWNFVFWGFLHGLLIVLDKLFWLDISRKIPRPINILFTFILVLIAWVFFRSDNLHHAWGYLKSMFNVSTLLQDSYIHNLHITNSFKTIFIISIFLTFIPAIKIYKTFTVKYYRVLSSNYFIMTVSIALLCLSIVKCVTSTFSPFIYFRF